MMESLKKQKGPGGAPAALGGLPATLGSLAGSLGGGLTGMAAGMAAGMLGSFVLGAASMGSQMPVLCCDKQIDVYQQQLSI